MTNKEFEQQKQAIIDFIFENLATPSKARKLVTLDKMIEKLQPPRPTCSTCKYYSASDSSCDNWDVVGDPSHDGFGCIEHSDYGDAK